MRFRTVFTAVLVVFALCTGVLGPASASDERRKKRAVDAAIENLKQDLSETSAQLARAVIALRQAEAKLPAARAAVARVRGQLAAAQARDRMLADQLKVAQAEVDRAERQIAATQQKIEETQTTLGKIASASYRQGSYAELAVVLDSDSPDDFATRLVLVQNAMRSQGAVLGDLAEDRADLAAQKATLDAKKAQLAAMKREQEKLVIKIKGLEQRALAAQRRVQALVAARAGAMRAVAREKAAEQRRLAQAQAQSRALARRIAALAAAAERRARAARRSHGGGFSGGGGSLFFPANGRISTYAGYRTNPVTGSPSCHAGIDIAPGGGAPIYAADSGVVIATTYNAWDGNTTIIAHGGGLTTWYAHQNSFGVSVGQQVRRGQVIGRVGASGFATGPHLHFNVVIGDTAYDPMGWFGGSRRTVASLCPNGPSPVL